MSLDMLQQFAPVAVDMWLLIGALTILLTDLVPSPGDKRMLAWGTLLTMAVAFCGTFAFDLTGEAWGGAYVGSAHAVLLKQIFLAGGILTVLGSYKMVAESYERRQGEFYQLLLYSLLGMTLLAGARDLILLVVCFELMGIPLYVLAAFSRSDGRAVEGGLKLYLIGAVSSVTMLFGMSLLFGLGGTTSISGVASYLAAHPSPLALLGVTLAITGMGFKLGVFPFHMWVPDTYESSKTPFVAFLSVAPKAAGIAALTTLLLSHGHALLNMGFVVLLTLATSTLIMGNLFALNQSNVKRLLGYSGVAHMGFLLMALLTGSEMGIAALMFYLVGYLFTNIGTFLVVHAVAQSGGDDSVGSFEGLISRSGWLSMAMLVFQLSLAGIPFVVGFWAKLYVFMAAWLAGMYWLVVLGALLSVVALFYYLRVARAMLMTEAREESKVTADTPTAVAIWVCLAMVVVMGLVPGPFVRVAEAAAAAFFGA